MECTATLFLLGLMITLVYTRGFLFLLFVSFLDLWRRLVATGRSNEDIQLDSFGGSEG